MTFLPISKDSHQSYELSAQNPLRVEVDLETPILKSQAAKANLFIGQLKEGALIQSRSIGQANSRYVDARLKYFHTFLIPKLEKANAFKPGKAKGFDQTLTVFREIKALCCVGKERIYSPELFFYFKPILEEVAVCKFQYMSFQEYRSNMEAHSQDQALLDMLGLWYVCDIVNQAELISFCQGNADIKRVRVAYGIGDQGLAQLADALRSKKTLTSLVIWQGEIGDAGAKALAAALQENITLKDLQLPNNRIGDEGARDFAAALKVNTTLTELSLSGNSVGNEGAKLLAEALEVNQSLMSISLFCNYYIHAEGVIALANSLLVNKKLVRLDLGSNAIGIDGLNALKKTQSLYPKREIILGFAA